MPCRIVFLAVVASVSLAGVAIAQSVSQKVNEAAPIAADTCLLELQAPTGATVTVDGRDYKTKRELTFNGLTPGKLYRTQVVVRVPGGTTDERTVWIEGGRRLRMTTNKPAAERPELVVQAGGSYHMAELSADGKYMLRGEGDGRAELIDVQTGRTLRFYGRVGSGFPKVAFSGDAREIYVSINTNELKAVLAFDRESGKELRRFEVEWHDDLIVSRDGRTMALLGSTYENDKRYLTVALYDPQSGRKLTSFRDETDGSSLRGQFSPNGRTLATIHTNYSGDGKAVVYLWDIATGKVAKKFRSNTAGHGAFEPHFSPDGKRLVFAVNHIDEVSAAQTAELVVIDLVAGRELARQTLPSANLWKLFFTRDGHIVTEWHRWENGRLESSIALYQANDLQLLREIGGGNGETVKGFVSLLPDGDTFVAYNGLWSLETGARVSQYEGADAFFGSFIPLADDERVVVCSDYGAALWNLKTQQSELLMDLPNTEFQAANWKLAKGDRWLYCWTYPKLGPAAKTSTAGIKSEFVAFDLAKDGLAQRFGASDETDARLIAAVGERAVVRVKEQIVVWDVARGLRLASFGENAIHHYSDLALSPDGQKLFGPAPQSERDAAHKAHTDKIYNTITGGASTQANDINALFNAPYRKPWFSVWSAAGGEKLKTVWADGSGYSTPSRYEVTGDGRQLVTLEQENISGKPTNYSKLVVWDLGTERSVRTIRVAANELSDLTFSSDSRFLAITGSDVGCLVVDLASGAQVRQFQAHSSYRSEPRFSRDGRRIWLGGGDNSAQLWDISTGEKSLHLTWVAEPVKSFDDYFATRPFRERFTGYHWLTVTPDGLFDGDAFARTRVSYRVGEGLNVVPVDRFFQDFYRPGLAASVLGGRQPTADVSFARKQAPGVRILSPKAGAWLASTATLEVEITDHGGGAAGIALYQNGSRVLAPGTTRAEGKLTFRTFEVPLIEGKNQFRVTATNLDGSWDAEPAEIALTYEAPIAKSDLHLVAIGVSKYADATFNLRFAAADAQAMAELFSKRGGRLYGNVHVTSVTDAEATREGILKALRRVTADSKPQDTLVVFLAGHGAMVGQRYFFVPHDLRKNAAELDDDLRKQGVAADELNDELTAAKALKRVLILDTCASGGAIQLASLSRSGVALRGAIERLSRASGVFTIAAASASEQAQESRELKHGILSYTLLAALKAVDSGPLEGKAVQPGNQERIVDVMEWFTFAAGNVPRLTEKLFGASQDVLTSTQGQSFPVLPLEE